ncbi:GH32 C-terminal domain-containing protein [Streptococcus sp. S784/96/1]|uniref:GH32 C-terminal domain-containing protein n=1 Tax=Streptococcus sp. S784/96/1 TaxID=2653499 RepID=UPI00138A3EAE|nr:GH32 C-terminal domain-containing protein [Streptococcus sp. S784/96/1]
MKFLSEMQCKNWYMHKRGKIWVYGCSALLTALLLANSVEHVAAETAVSTNSEPLVVQSEPEVSEPLVKEEPKNEVLAETSTTELAVSTSEEAISEEGELETAPSETEVNPVNTEEDSEPKLVVTDTKEPSRTAVTPATTGYQTNLENLSYDDEVWKVQEDGLYSNAVGKGDNFLYTESQGKNFIFETDVTFLKNEGAASLTFRSNNNPDNLKNYTVNLDANSRKARLWRWAEANLIDDKEVTATPDNKYHLKVVATDEWLSYYVNDELIANLSDFTLQRNDKGQTTSISEGYFGLLNWNGEMIFQNTFYTSLRDSELPFIEDIVVTSAEGTVENKGQFFQKEATHIQYVKNDAKTVNLEVLSKQAGTTVTVQDSKGVVYNDLKNIPLEVGANYFTVTSQLLTASGQPVNLTYRLNVHRRQADEVYYNELHRGQFHYSVKDGWANDPNGLVYYNGTYHLFYQFHDDTKWGPMHWAHATSKDLLAWEEQPIALYPDANGTMFSGSIVVDDKNTSGLFEEGKGGLVALITVNGEGQRIKLAYSTDEGKTWQKSDKIAADWSNDPLNNRDFRDPKVFRWENQWFMVIAGGPLRIYSSDNLSDWKVESTYPDLHTECPDLYPLKADDGSLKWVLSRGGRHYKVGDFKQVDGGWRFIPDSSYGTKDEIMNFGKDSYAAMTYYVQDFGTSSNPTIPEVIELNWMNTWDDYCNLVADTVDQDFNGTFNLNLSLGLKKDGDRYVLTQTPIKAYESLREVSKAITYTNATVTETNDLFKEFVGDTYEIVAHFKPGENTSRLGFKLRVGDDEATKVVYDMATEMLSIDRSQSGIILTNKFAQIDQQKVTRHADGSIDLHLFVDRSSVEVFAKGNTVAGANQIFPSPTSLGVNVFSEGDSSKADIALYPLTSIWKNKKEVTTALDVIAASPKVTRVTVGEKLPLKAYIMPAVASQDLAWTVSDSSIASLSIEGNKAVLTGLKKGQVLVRATSKENPSLYEDFMIDLFEDNFNTNLPALKAVGGKWYIDGETLSDTNQSANDAYMNTQVLPFSEYKMGVDIKYTKGIVNLFLAAASSDPANAYAVQFGDRNNVRLYRFYGDTIQEVPMDVAINDGIYHHIDVIKTLDTIKVSVDGKEFLVYKFESVEESFNKPFVGLGLWDGQLDIQNFLVTDLNSKIQSKPELNDELDDQVGSKNQEITNNVEVDTSEQFHPENLSQDYNADKDSLSPMLHMDSRVINPVSFNEIKTEGTLPKTNDGTDSAFGLGLLTLLGAFLSIVGLKRKQNQ